MNERNVASGADSLYPRGRVWNMSNRDSKDEIKFREEARERQKREREESVAFAKRLENPESAAETKTKHLEDLLRGGYHPDSKLSPALKDFVETGVFSSSLADKPVLPIPGLEGPSQKIRPHVIEDASGTTIVESSQLLQFLSRDLAVKALSELGFGDVNLPQDWNNMAAMKKAQWLREEQSIFLVQQFDAAKERDLILPMMAGGSGLFDWDNVLEEKYVEAVENKLTGDVEMVEKTRPITAKVAISRLVEMIDQKSLPHSADLLKEIDGDFEKLDKHFKETYLDRAVAIAEGRIKDYTALNEMAHTINDLGRRFSIAGKQALFEKVFSADVSGKLNMARKKLDDTYREQYKANPLRYEELFRRMEEEAAQVIQIQKYGLYGRGDSQRRSFDAVADSEIRAAANEEDREMLRWRKSTLREGFDLNYGEIRIKQPTADWRDSGKNLDLILRFLERTDFSEQQLSAALQSAAQIVQDIPVNSEVLSKADKEEAIKLQKELTEKLQAILAVDSFYAVMEHADMNPEKVLGALGSLKDETFEIFFERFSKDSNGNEITFLKDGKKEELNILNVGMNVYMKRLNVERRVMNYIEKWTRNIDVQPGRAEAGIEDQCIAAIDNIYTRTGGSRDVSKIKDAVSVWYRENTLLGAHDEHTKDKRKDEMVGDMRAYEKLSDAEKAERDDWQANRKWKTGLIEELRDEYKIDEKQLEAMIDSGMIEQVMNNAHRLSWMMAWSDYDGIRIWDPKAENPARPGTGRQAAFVYNGSTHMFHGRMIDHAWEFFVDEKRGRVPKSNLIMQDELLGEHGNLLPQNRSMVRLAKDMMGGEAFKEYIDSHIGGFKNIDKFDWQNSEEERGWAESAIISEGIDSGELNFGESDFASMFKSTGSWKYRWIDLYGDRKAQMDYMGAGVLQKYLQTPNSEMFFQINSLENFYSKREVRLQPWMKLAIGAHQRIGEHWKDWWGLPDRMTHAEKEAVIEISTASNRLNPDYKNSMKHRYLGWGAMPGIMPVRGARQLGEAADIFSREFGTGMAKNSWRMPVAWGNAFVSQGMKYIFS